jgi:hypothetical protein
MPQNSVAASMYAGEERFSQGTPIELKHIADAGRQT